MRTLWSSLTALRLTTRLGVDTKSLVRSSKSVPPARISDSSQFAARSLTASSLVVGLAYSNCCISPVLLFLFTPSRAPPILCPALAAGLARARQSHWLQRWRLPPPVKSPAVRPGQSLRARRSPGRSSCELSGRPHQRWWPVYKTPYWDSTCAQSGGP